MRKRLVRKRLVNIIIKRKKSNTSIVFLIFFQLLFFQRSFIFIRYKQYRDIRDNDKKRDLLKKDFFMVSIKRITAGILGLTIAGILITGCEKFDGPEPFLCKRLDLNQLVLISAAEQGEVPLGPAIPLNSLEKLIISDIGMQAIVDIPEYADGIPIEMVRKIIFQ